MKTKTKKIYEIEATNDTEMIVQTVVPTTHGQKLAKVLTDLAGE